MSAFTLIEFSLFSDIMKTEWGCCKALPCAEMQDMDVSDAVQGGGTAQTQERKAERADRHQYLTKPYPAPDPLAPSSPLPWTLGGLETSAVAPGE